MKKKRFQGQIFGLYIINYSVIRFITEYFRGDHSDKTYLFQGSTPLLSLSFSQVYCVLGLGAGILFTIVMKKRQRA